MRVALLASLGVAGRRSGAALAAKPPRIVVVGAGFGGAGFALALRHLAPHMDITIVDPQASYHACPTSNQVIAGLRGMDSIAVSYRGLSGAGIRHIRDRAESIDAGARRVRLRSGMSLGYDRLVMAPGIRFLWERIEGLTPQTSALVPHAWQAGEQTRTLARQLAAMRPGGVFAISVPAGPMRCPPGPFERASLAAARCVQRNPRAKILIFDANNRFPRQDVFTEFWRRRYGAMIEWIPVVEGGAVTRVDAAARTLYSASGTHRVDVASIIPPQAPAALAVSAGLASDHGWCPVDPATFASTQAEGIQVLGDACIADPMPKSASAAHAQALVAARALRAHFEGGEPAPARLQSVCFSMLAEARALAIHGRFAVENGALRQETGGEAAVAEPDLEQGARDAAAWYREIVADSFGIRS